MSKVLMTIERNTENGKPYFYGTSDPRVDPDRVRIGVKYTAAQIREKLELPERSQICVYMDGEYGSDECYSVEDEALFEFVWEVRGRGDPTAFERLYHLERRLNLEISSLLNRGSAADLRLAAALREVMEESAKGW